MSEPEIPYRAELLRKAIHLAALILPLGMWYLERNTALIVLGACAGLALFGDIARVRFAWFQKLVATVFGWIMRPKEIPQLGEPVRLNGATWVCISALLLTLLFPREAAVPALTMFMLADAAAALVGRKWGIHPWLSSSKTIEGTAAFVVIGAVILFQFSHIPFLTAMVLAIIAAGLEILDRPLNDNVQVPFLTALLLHFWPF